MNGGDHTAGRNDAPLPLPIVFVLLQRWFVEGIATTGVKG